MNFNNLDQLYRSVIMDHYKNPRNKGVFGQWLNDCRHEQSYLR